MILVQSLSHVSQAGESEVPGEERCWGLSGVQLDLVWKVPTFTPAKPWGQETHPGLLWAPTFFTCFVLLLFSTSIGYQNQPVPCSGSKVCANRSVNIPWLSGFEFPPWLCPWGPWADVVPCHSAPIFQWQGSCVFFYSNIKTGLHLAMLSICPAACSELISQICSK